MKKETYIFDEDNNIPYMQDMGVHKSVPSGIKFTVKEDVMFKNEDWVTLIAKGYGDKNDYGNGAISIHEKYLEDDEMEGDKSVYDLEWESAELLRTMEALDDTPEWIARNACKSFLARIGYDVIKREPELLPCPNPECGRECKIFDSLDDIWVQCNYCYYRSPEARTVKEAVRLHSQMPRIKR